MENIVSVGDNAYKIEGNSIKVGKVVGSRNQKGHFEPIPKSSENSVIIEQAPNSCYLDPQGDGVRKLQELGVSSSEGQKAIDEINTIIEEVDWTVPWLKTKKTSPWLCIFFLLHLIGVCIVALIVGAKEKAVKKKRDELMTKAREFARNYNSNSREFEIRIPDRFTQYVEFIVKPNLANNQVMPIAPMIPQQQSYDQTITIQYQQPINQQGYVPNNGGVVDSSQQQQYSQQQQQMYPQPGIQAIQPTPAYYNDAQSQQFQQQMVQPMMQPQQIMMQPPSNVQPSNQTIAVQLNQPQEQEQE